MAIGYVLFKGVITALVVVGVSELAKRSSLLAAVLASLPLTSILAMTWLYLDTKSVQSVKSLSYGIFWMVLPSLFFFLIFPIFLKLGLRFYLSLGAACVATSAAYVLYIWLLRRIGVQI